MKINLHEPRLAINPAFLKIKPNRNQIEVFKSNLIELLDNCNEKETEEHHKDLVSDFLKKTYYYPNYFVNTKGRIDLVIHTGATAKSPVGVIIEAKSTTNKTEMISLANLNGKALQELILYFLRERITNNNLEIKNLIVTNIYEWFVFDAQVFDKLFAQNKKLVKDFQEFETKQLSIKTTDLFYSEIAKPFIEKVKTEIQFSHFDFRDYNKALRNTNKEDDKSLIALYKLLSPEHLLKLSFANDSNTLDKNFYNELLHIIGLNDFKDGGKRVIGRHKLENRSEGSLLENTIIQLETLDKISRLENPKQYGETKEDQLFAIALELTITWVNRILFLKLLEAQLITYHTRDKSYSFLNSNSIPDYDILNKLFFQVLAKKVEDRTDKVAAEFAKVPYLNSSLFEPTTLEHQTILISNLENNLYLPLLKATVIKNEQGKKATETKNALDYFFSFLDSYDFASEGSEDIQEDNKTLINASVLGLIFEKINGYKDGSFFTPSFITMYMCKETIRRAVVTKFNEIKNWTCDTFDELKNKDFTIEEGNKIINSIKICDPAVGSGHFLVSALNEIITIKHELQLLADTKFIRLKNYTFQVVNDELIVTDEIGKPFVYYPKNDESQRVQETLFHEKQTIIESCLFGVDINPNSVKICRLRLWIELLKNAYYYSPNRVLNPNPNRVQNPVRVDEENQLQTLPNIDINIKCGNSLISRFALDADLKKALQQSKWNIESYKLAVSGYQNAETKEQKREMERLIDDIKENFETEIAVNDKRKTSLEDKKGQLFNFTQQVAMFEQTKKQKEEWNKKVNKLAVEVKLLDDELNDIKSNKIYQNAFEWRFEFPQVLNDDGDFIGFDVVIGNPPYITILLGKNQSYDIQEANFYRSNYQTFEYKGNTYVLFIERANEICKINGILNYIIPNTLLLADTYSYTRNFLLQEAKILELVNCDFKVFDEAEIGGTLLLMSQKNKFNVDNNIGVLDFKNYFFDNNTYNNINQTLLNNVKSSKFYLNNTTIEILNKSRYGSKNYGGIVKIYQGVITGDNNKFISSERIDNRYEQILRGKDINNYSKSFSNNYLLFDKKVLWSNTDEINFYQQKLISRQTSDTLIAVYDDENYLTLDSTHVHTLTDSNFELKFLLSLFNSKFLRFLYKLMVQEEGRVFAQVKTVVLKELPIKEIPVEAQQPFINKVNEILTLKKEKPQADTSSLENDIDVMVYELYGLSDEEIGIVEKS